MECSNTTVETEQTNTVQCSIRNNMADHNITIEQEQNNRNLPNSIDIVEDSNINVNEYNNILKRSNNNRLENNNVIMCVQNNPEENNDSNLFKNILGKFFKKIYYIIILANTTFLDIYHKGLENKTVEVVESSDNNSNRNNGNSMDNEDNMSGSNMYNGYMDTEMRNSLFVGVIDRNETSISRDGESIMSISSGNSSIDNTQPLLMYGNRRNRMALRIDNNSLDFNRSGTISSGDLSIGSESFRIIKGNYILRDNTVNSQNREMSYSPISRINSSSSYSRHFSIMSLSRPGSSIHSSHSQIHSSNTVQFKAQSQIQRKIQQHNNNELSSNISDIISLNNSCNGENENENIEENTTIPFCGNEMIMSDNDCKNSTNETMNVSTNGPAPDYEEPKYDTIPNYNEIYNDNNEVSVPVDEKCDRTISDFLIDIDLQKLQIKEKVEYMDIELARTLSLNEMNLPERMNLSNESNFNSNDNQNRSGENGVNHQKSLDLSYIPEDRFEISSIVLDDKNLPQEKDITSMAYTDISNLDNANLENKFQLNINNANNNEINNVISDNTDYNNTDNNNTDNNNTDNNNNNTDNNNDNNNNCEIRNKTIPLNNSCDETYVQELSKSNADLDDTYSFNGGLKKINDSDNLCNDATSLFENNSLLDQYSALQNTESENSNTELYKALNSLEENMSRLNESLTLINIKNPQEENDN
ncbi:hypothetical protein PIROE2DRAFT_21176 [Piromyces sp. E2]|nr:hypothetical protein PIROE2DRAFT_21176 [Piromyces sp. E2]|eukprot:OUM59816.1 hypothetical protein PIROE2DRAFT_21176 [Piromyces sp. E2]